MTEGTARVSKTFESKVASLIATTRHLAVPQILVLRRLTLRDPEARKWASDKQLNVVFNVILTKAAERLGLDRLKAARDRGFAMLLAGGDEATRQEDARVLSDLAMQILGPPQLTEAESAQAGFEALLARGANMVTPPRTQRTRGATVMKEPPPLFAAQLGSSRDKMVSAKALMMPQGEGSDGKPVDFAKLFDDTLCAYSRKILQLFRITGSSKGMRLPFLVAPEFADLYEEILRRHILPQMRSTRHVGTLAHSYNWAEVGGDKLIEIIQGSEVNNPVLHNWDARWNAFRTPKSTKHNKKHQGPKPEDNPWPMIREEAVRGNFLPPTEENLQMLQDIIRQEADVLAKAWREISQLYQQEFQPSGRQEQAREGALRDSIMKWSQKLPDHVGEHLAIRAYFDFERCDGTFMRRLVGSFGRSDSERRRNAPFLSEFVLTLHE